MKVSNRQTFKLETTFKQHLQLYSRYIYYYLCIHRIALSISSKSLYAIDLYETVKQEVYFQPENI